MNYEEGQRLDAIIQLLSRIADAKAPEGEPKTDRYLSAIYKELKEMNSKIVLPETEEKPKKEKEHLKKEKEDEDDGEDKEEDDEEDFLPEEELPPPPKGKKK